MGSMNLKENHLKNSILIFCVCIAVHAFEVLVIKTDETIFAECFINKVFGIIVLFYILKKLDISFRTIGFVKESFLINSLKGLAICMIFYSIGFIAEFAILYCQGNQGHFEFFVTGFSLTGNVIKQTGIGFVIMCIFFNIINVWMEEGLFRGFYITYLSEAYSAKAALYIAALLFGIWHIVTPLRSVITGEMNVVTFILMSIGYIILSALMGIKWGLLYQHTKTIWVGMADHFFNNCVITNLTHVVTDTGVDDLQILRVLIGELTSFIAVLLYYRMKDKKSSEQI